jgi:hypothetical protein
MDGKELYNLYEAYMEVVENQQLDEEKNPLKNPFIGQVSNLLDIGQLKDIFVEKF